MMAMVRTSLQKVVVFLHRLQRMAISSPRYQKLCKVCAQKRVDWKRVSIVVVVFLLANWKENVCCFFFNRPLT